MVSVRAVLEMPDLRLTVRTGADLLDRPISRIYGTELPDPGRFLSGGELVLSGLLWLRSDEDVPAFVAALAEAGVAALIACDADTGVIPPALVRECRRRDVPLLEAVVDLSFAVITDRVGLELATERFAPDVHRGHHRRLISALGGGAGIEELLRLGARELGAPCWVLTPLGRVVAAAGPELAEARRAALVREFLLADGRLKRVRGRGGQAVSLLPVDDPTGPDLTRWFLAVGGPELGDPAQPAESPGEEVVAELVSLIGVQRSRERDRRRVENRVVGALLRSVLSGSVRPAEIVATALSAGLDASGAMRVLAISVRGGGAEHAVAVLEELVALLEPSGVVTAVDEEVYALLPVTSDSDPDLAGRAASAVRLLGPALGERRVAIGISSAVSVVDLRGAVQEARHARRLGDQRHGRTVVVAGEEVAVHQLLLATVPDELRRALRRRVLGPVFDYDAEHGTNLAETLAVFLDRGGSWTRAASELHVHVNTLRYRVGKVEELIGADLSDFGQRVDVYLALRAGS